MGRVRTPGFFALLTFTKGKFTLKGKVFCKMKKIYLFALVAMMVSVRSFAHEEQVQHFAATIDPIPLLVGPALGGFGIAGSFEFAPLSRVSARTSIYYLGAKLYGIDENASTDVKFSLFRFTLEGRFYPFSPAPRGFFLGGGYGFNTVSGSARVKSEGKSDSGSLNFHTLFLDLGYKICFGSEPRAPIFIEPSLAYNFLLDSSVELEPAVALLLGATGTSIGLTVGVAF
jgi:hypothetical protein